MRINRDDACREHTELMKHQSLFTLYTALLLLGNAFDARYCVPSVALCRLLMEKWCPTLGGHSKEIPVCLLPWPCCNPPTLIPPSKHMPSTPATQNCLQCPEREMNTWLGSRWFSLQPAQFCPLDTHLSRLSQAFLYPPSTHTISLRLFCKHIKSHYNGLTVWAPIQSSLVKPVPSPLTQCFSNCPHFLRHYRILSLLSCSYAVYFHATEKNQLVLDPPPSLALALFPYLP